MTPLLFSSDHYLSKVSCKFHIHNFKRYSYEIPYHSFWTDSMYHSNSATLPLATVWLWDLILVIAGPSEDRLSIWRCRLTSIGIPILKIRRSRDRLIFNMAIPVPGKDGLYTETGPRYPSSFRHQVRYSAHDGPHCGPDIILNISDDEILRDSISLDKKAGHHMWRWYRKHIFCSIRGSDTAWIWRAIIIIVKTYYDQWIVTI